MNGVGLVQGRQSVTVSSSVPSLYAHVVSGGFGGPLTSSGTVNQISEEFNLKAPLVPPPLAQLFALYFGHVPTQPSSPCQELLQSSPPF